MRYFKRIDLGWAAGDIGGLFHEAKQVATMLDAKVTFEFNGVTVCITEKSTIEHVFPVLMECIRSEKLSCYGEGW